MKQQFFNLLTLSKAFHQGISPRRRGFSLRALATGLVLNLAASFYIQKFSRFDSHDSDFVSKTRLNLIERAIYLQF